MTKSASPNNRNTIMIITIIISSYLKYPTYQKLKCISLAILAILNFHKISYKQTSNVQINLSFVLKKEYKTDIDTNQLVL